MTAATHDLYQLATAYAKARAVHETKPSEFYIWMESSFDVRMLRTNRLSGQHVRFQERSAEYPIPVSASELDSSSRGYLEIRHSDCMVVVGYSSCTSVWCFGDKLKNVIRKLWPKYIVIEESKNGESVRCQLRHGLERKPNLDGGTATRI